MTLIKLTNPRICPACRKTDRISLEGRTYQQCPICGMYLFKRPESLMNYWRSGFVESWYYHPSEGWIHSDHVVNGFRPNDAEMKVKKPD